MNKRKIMSGLYQLLCLLLGLAVILPILYAVSISFMRPAEILNRSIHFLPNQFYLGNYLIAITKTTLFRFMWNSLFVAIVSSLVRVMICSMAAFAFAFYEFPGKKAIFMLYLGTMMIPPDILIVQNYSLAAKMNLVNTYLGIMIIYFVSAMSVFILRQNFLTYSKSLKEVAYIDGCGNFRFYWSILLPSSMTALITVFIASFVGVWNIYLWPLIVTNQNEMRTVQVAITMLNFPDDSPYGAIMAASVLILIPSVLVFLIFQRKIKSGIMVGSVKG